MGEKQQLAENPSNRIVDVVRVSLDTHTPLPRSDHTHTACGAGEHENERVGSEGFRGRDCLAVELLTHE